MDLYRGSAFEYSVKVQFGVIRALRLGLCTVTLIHLGACLWAALGKGNLHDDKNWIERNDLLDASNWTVYLTAVYFCFVTLTTVGYGDITAFTSMEIYFAIFWMLFGVAFYSFTIGIITAFYTDYETKSSILERRKIKTERFCKTMNFSIMIENKVKNALKYASNKMTYPWLDPNQTVFLEFPLKLKYEYLVAIYPELVLECPFFSCYDASFVAAIVPLLKPIEFLPGEIVWKKNDIAGSVYFLVGGEVHFLMNDICPTQVQKLEKDSHQDLPKTMGEILESVNNNKNNPVAAKINYGSVYKKCSPGSYFGDVDIMMQRRRTCHLRALTRCDAFILSRMDFENAVMGEFPHVWLDLKILATKKDQQDRLLIKKKKEYQKAQNSMNQFPSSRSIVKNLENFEKRNGIARTFSSPDRLNHRNQWEGYGPSPVLEGNESEEESPQFRPDMSYMNEFDKSGIMDTDQDKSLISTTKPEAGPRQNLITDPNLYTDATL